MYPYIDMSEEICAPTEDFPVKTTFVDRMSLLTDELTAFTERRLLFALSRFGDRIERVQVNVEDVNSKIRGGVDKSCRIDVHLRKLPSVHVTADDSSLHAALASAADRAGQAVSRAIEKYRTLRRRTMLPV